MSKIIRIFEFFDGAVQKTIEEQVESTELKTVHIAVQNKFKNSYCEIMGAAEDFITQRPRFDSSWIVPTNVFIIISNTNTDTYSRIKLSKIELSTFDGNYNHWIKI